ncbi:CrcB family protein [Bifidobacterium callitrichos]|uniref:Fluoride-specific ion channel FluC n=1 Tax=Bifidobacterium callitrichos TaxID=762209 RepID=A0A5M9ZDA2_9BIFI|nr:CrcB family protein [Bifidobacterium callitrichos]KAA8816605.1 CrcB family protein [Bifidobacterium callitrichos]
MPEYFAEPDPSTQEMTAAHARSYAVAAPHPKGAAAAERPPQIPLAPVKRVQAQFNPLADGMIYLVVFLGGAIGTAMRYGLSLALPAPAAETGFFSAFHTATFIANMAACFMFAALTAYMSQASWIRKRVRQLTSRGIGMGMCGGFSTLSAMVIEELTSIHGSQIGGFLFYMFVSFAVGMLVAAAGAWLATSVASRRSARIAAGAINARAGHKAPKSKRFFGLGDRIADDPVVHVVDDTSSVFIDVRSSTPPAGDYGQPVPAARTVQTGAGAAGGVPESMPDATAIPSYEPAPITDEIPMVGDPATGGTRESHPESGVHGAAAGNERTFLYRDAEEWR